MLKRVLLQAKFLLVASLNFLYWVMPFFILRHALLRALGVKMGRGSSMHRKIRFFDIGKIAIGNNCTVNRGVYLDSRRGIKIGNNVMIAHEAKIYTLGHDANEPDFPTKGDRVIIEDNVVIYPHAMVMPGVTVGEGAVVYPGAVVTRDVVPFSIVGGVPARVIGMRNRDIQYKLDYRYWLAP